MCWHFQGSLHPPHRTVQSAGDKHSREMLDIVCLIFVRGRSLDEAMLEMAKDRGLVVMATGHRMFSACGMLYEAGLHGGAI